MQLGKPTCLWLQNQHSMFGNEELRPFLETPKLILTFIQTTDIGLKQRLM